MPTYLRASADFSDETGILGTDGDELLAQLWDGNTPAVKVQELSIDTPGYTSLLKSPATGKVWAKFTIPDGYNPGYILWVPPPSKALPSLLTAVNPADYEPGNIGSGSRKVTVTVRKASDSTGISGAKVSIRNDGGTETKAWAYTDGSGQIVFALDDGEYDVLIDAGSSYTPPGVQNLTVDGDETPIYSLTAQTASPPAFAGLCTVFFRARDGGAGVAPGCTVEAELIANNLIVADALLTRQKVSDTADGAGEGELQLIQTGQISPGKLNVDRRYRFTVRDVNGEIAQQFEREVPNQSSVNLWQLV